MNKTYILTGSKELLQEMKDELLQNGYVLGTVNPEWDKVAVYINSKCIDLYACYAIGKKITLTPSNYDEVKQKILNDE